MPLFHDKLEEYRRKPTLDFWPFSYQGSVNLHWERALLELGNLHALSHDFKAFLRTKFRHDNQTDLATLRKLEDLFQRESLSTTKKIVHAYSYCVDWLSLFRNAYEILALSIKPLSLQLPFVGLAWQLFDTIMLGTMAVSADQKEDKWARNHYLYNTSQLMLCAGIALSALILSACSLLSILSTLAGAIGGTSALIISWILSERAAKLCDARINYLIHEELSIEKLTLAPKVQKRVGMSNPSHTDNANLVMDETKKLDNTQAKLQEAYQLWHQEIQNSNNTDTSYKTLMSSLQIVEENLENIHKNNNVHLDNYHETKLALALCKNQIKKREFLYRLEKPLKFYALTTVALAIIGLVLFSIGASIATFGFAAVLFCPAVAIFSSVYNLYQKNQLLNADNSEHSNCTKISHDYPHTLFYSELNNVTMPGHMQTGSGL